MRSVVDDRISLKAVARGTPTVSSGRKATVRSALRRGRRTPPGSQSGAGLHRGRSGTWESPLSPCHIPGVGDRVTTGPGVAWGVRPDHEPMRDTTTRPKPARYWGARAKRRGPRGAERPSERSIVPGKGGNGGPRDPREGRRRRAARGAGQHDGRDGEITHRHTTTPAPCGAGRPGAAPGLHDPRVPHCHRLAAGGIPAHEQGEWRRDRWRDGAAVGRTPRRDPAGRA